MNLLCAFPLIVLIVRLSSSQESQTNIGEEKVVEQKNLIDDINNFFKPTSVANALTSTSKPKIKSSSIPIIANEIIQSLFPESNQTPTDLEDYDTQTGNGREPNTIQEWMNHNRPVSAIKRPVPPLFQNKPMETVNIPGIPSRGDHYRPQANGGRPNPIRPSYAPAPWENHDSRPMANRPDEDHEPWVVPNRPKKSSTPYPKQRPAVYPDYETNETPDYDYYEHKHKYKPNINRPQTRPPSVYWQNESPKPEAYPNQPWHSKPETPLRPVKPELSSWQNQQEPSLWSNEPESQRRPSKPEIQPWQVRPQDEPLLSKPESSAWQNQPELPIWPYIPESQGRPSKPQVQSWPSKPVPSERPTKSEPSGWADNFNNPPWSHPHLPETEGEKNGWGGNIFGDNSGNGIGGMGDINGIGGAFIGSNSGNGVGGIGDLNGMGGNIIDHNGANGIGGVGNDNGYGGFIVGNNSGNGKGGIGDNNGLGGNKGGKNSANGTGGVGNNNGKGGVIIGNNSGNGVGGVNQNDDYSLQNHEIK